MSKLSLDTIQLLNLIKETGSFSTAAEKLHRTPSAISYRVSNVEKQLGHKLFIRNGPIIELSKTGHFIAAEGLWILKAIDNIESRLNTGNNKRHALRVGISDSMPFSGVADLFKTFMDEHSGFRINIDKFIGGEEWNHLGENELDVVFSVFPAPKELKINNMLISMNKIVCCAMPGYWQMTEAKNPLSPDEHHVCTLICNSSCDNIEIIRNNKLDINSTIVIDDILAQIDLIKRGCGIGLLPLQLVREMLNKNEMEIVPLEGISGLDMMWAGLNNMENKHTRWWREHLTEINNTVNVQV